MRKVNLIGMVSSMGVAIATLANPVTAAAQDASQAQAPATPPAAAKPAATDGEIIVTAERKEQSMQKYAGTAVVISGQALQERGVQNIADLEGRIPGLEILANNNNYEVYIRGVGSNNNTELGDPAAGTYYDGIYIPRPAGFGSIFYDIDRVEVSDGPQGTLRGRNATAGTVNIIPWHPGLNVWDGYAEAGIGNYGQKSVEGSINAPITDNMAIRLSGEHLYHDGYTNNVGPVSGLRGPEWEDNFAGRAQLLYKPSDQFDFLLSYDNTIENGGGTIGTNVGVAEGAGVDISSLNLRDVYAYPTDPHQHTVHSGEKGEFNYHAKAFNVQFTVSHRHLFTDWVGAPPGQVAFPNGLAAVDAGDAAGNIADDWSHYETQNASNSGTQELRITALKGSRLDWTLGGYHFTESQGSFLGSVASQNAYFQGNEFNTRTQSTSWAGYTDATFHVDSKFALTGGLRYTDDQKQRTGVAARYMMLLGDGHYNCCMGPIIGSPGFQFMGLGRTDFTVPTSAAETTANQQAALSYYLAGIKSFGVDDTVPGIFPGGLIPAGPSGSCAPNPGSGLYCAGPGYNWGAAGTNGQYLYASGIDPSGFWLQNASDHYHFVDWRVRGQYDFNPDHMLYGLIADGHKAGGFNDNLGTGGPVLTYNPEEVTNFEIGSKNRFTVAGAPVKLNVSAFYMAYKNQQITDLQTLNQESALLNVTPSSGGAVVVDYTFNAAQSAIMGATFEGNIAIPQAKMNLGFNVLWMPEAKVTGAQTIEDSRFQSDVDPDNAGQVSIQGHRLPRTPRLGMNLNLAQKFQTSAGGFDYVVAPGYRSSSHATIYNGVDYAAAACAAGGTILDANGNAVSGCTAVAASPNRARLNDTLAGYWTLDVGGGYTNPNGRLRLEAYVNNIVKQPVSGLVISETGGTVAFLPRPTTYGLRASMRF